MAFSLHHVKFYKVKPQVINVLSYEEESRRLAVARADQTIEIWNFRHTPFVERRILSSVGSVEGLAWYNGRLFSGGLQGSVVEYDLHLQEPKTVHPVTAGACWCLAAHKERKLIAAGTQEGYINLFDIMEDELVFNKLLDKQTGKILCIIWDHEGDFIITGSVDMIRLWSVTSGTVVHRMATGRSEQKKPTIVWSLAVGKDLTIISGDSRGRLTFWNGKNGTCISSNHCLKADVLTVTVDKEKEVVYCAGVDPEIIAFEKVLIRCPNDKAIATHKWVKSTNRHIHDHTVRAIAFFNGKLVSGGIDGYLAVSCDGPRTLVKYPPLLSPSAVQPAAGSHCLLLRYPLHFEVWKLGSSKEEKATKIIEWKSQSDLFIQCAQISNDANWIAVSTSDRFRLYHLDINSERPSLSKAIVPKNGGDQSLIAVCFKFSTDSSTLAIVTVTGKVHLLSLGKTEITFISSFEPYAKGDLKDAVHLMELSEDGKFLVVADLSYNIVVFSEGKIYTKLPRHNSLVTAMAIQCGTDYLVAAYADKKIIEYSLPRRKLTKFSKTVNQNELKQWTSRSYPVLNISFDPTHENIIFLHDDSYILVINKEKTSFGVNTKIPKFDSPFHSSCESSSSNQSNRGDKITECGFHYVKRYKHLAYFGPFGESEMIAVEVSPQSLLEQLPPPVVKKKRFGGISSNYTGYTIGHES